MLILGLHEPTDGTVIWSGLPLASLTPEQERRFRRDVQVMFQDPYGSLNPRLTVRSIIGRPLKLHGLAGSAEIDREVRRLLELVGLSPPARTSIAFRTNFPAASASGSPLPARSRSSRASSSPTSRSPRSTFRPGADSHAPDGVASASSDCRCCSRPTISAWCAISPIAWR